MEITLSKSLLIAVVLAPLFGSIIAGLFGRQVKRFGAQTITILGVAVACGLSMYTLYQLLWGGAQPFNQNIYTFFEVGQYSAHVGFMVDKLTAMMMVVVTVAMTVAARLSHGHSSQAHKENNQNGLHNVPCSMSRWEMLILGVLDNAFYSYRPKKSPAKN